MTELTPIDTCWSHCLCCQCRRLHFTVQNLSRQMRLL
ncbi:hypothetical protein V6Z12_D09G194100 [Gossypium hirsutum]